MIRMDLGTKQVFLSGLLAWLITVGASVVSYTKLQENHDVRINSNEQASKMHFNMLQQQQKQITDNQRNSAITAEALIRLSDSQDKFTELFTQMNRSVIQTETTLEIIKDKLEK